MTTFGDLASKAGWSVLYERADRHGVEESAFSNTAYNLSLIVTVGVWAIGPEMVACESHAGVSSPEGFTREAVRRLDTSLTEFEESYDVAQELMDPAFSRADQLAQSISKARKQGRTELFDGRFVAERAADSL